MDDGIMHDGSGKLDNAPDGYTETGYLIVNTYTARGAIPVEGSLVTVFFGDAAMTSPEAVLTTDESGKTAKLSLPAPPKSTSLIPGGGEGAPPYGIYNISIIHEGFIPVYDIGVKIFSGVTAIQSADLIPEILSSPPDNIIDDTDYVDETGDYNL
ncbi:MAG: hypothetical protein LUH59_06510 [Firmicutes bacterium]|nr:hypothetical protein [Bacillota bacterium]